MFRLLGTSAGSLRLRSTCERVPREELVEPGFEEFAYEDGRFPIGEGRGETRVRASLSPTFAGPDATAVCKL